MDAQISEFDETLEDNWDAISPVIQVFTLNLP